MSTSVCLPLFVNHMGSEITFLYLVIEFVCLKIFSMDFSSKDNMHTLVCMI